MFRFITPQKIIFGKGSLDSIGKEVGMFGRKVFLVCGKESMRTSGLLKKVEELLSLNHLEVILYEGIPPEPSLYVVDDGIRLARKEGCEVVLAVGGGSVIDVGKAVAGLVRDGGRAVEYQRGREITVKGIPFVAIPTTSGTGAEVTYNAVILNEEDRVKQSIRDPGLVASLAIVDPLLTLSLPPRLTAITGIDALTHLIEAYTSKGANPITDSLAIKGIALIGKHLRGVVKEGGDLEGREAMSLASLLGGMTLANAGLGAVHGLAASLGPSAKIPHGVACAILLPYVVEYNYSEVQTRYSEINMALGGRFKSLHDTIRSLFDEIGISVDLDVGLGIDLVEVAKKASSSIRYNPRETELDDLVSILKRAMIGGG